MPRATPSRVRRTHGARRTTMRFSRIASVSILGLALSGPSGREQNQAELARAAFDRIKAMAGVWDGRSTKGWEESLRYQVIAGGSVVLETSFDAHPNEAMATAFHMDGDRLMLTHYCMAKNQ